MFYSGEFIFNGISSNDMSVCLVSFDGNVLEEYGVEYVETINSDTSTNGRFYYNTINEVNPITLNIALVDKNDTPMKWDTGRRLDVSEWLMTDTFSPFISKDNLDIIYYFKCISIKKKFNHNMHGVLEVVMQPESPYAFTPIIEDHYDVKDKYSIIINNTSNVVDKYYPKIEFIYTGDDGGTVSIKNNSTYTNSFEITNLKHGDKIYIDGSIKYILDESGKSRLIDSNRQWIFYRKGINKIDIEGCCDITFISQYPLMV